MNGNGMVFWLSGFVLLYGAEALTRLIPEYAAELWRRRESEVESMVDRFAAARFAIQSVIGNQHNARPVPPSKLFIVIGAVLIVLDYHAFGPSGLGFASQLFLLSQLVLGMICHKHGFLPDVVLLPLAAVGLLLGAGGQLLTPAAVIWGLFVGGGVFLAASIFSVMSKGTAGVSEGVIKHAAVVGVWLGPVGSLTVLFFSAIIGSFGVMAVRRLTGGAIEESINFGPIYAATAILVFLGGQMFPSAMPLSFLTINFGMS